jgi:MFS family permease
MQDRKHFLFLNIGHFLDHLFTLIFASVAALVLAGDWGMTYAELIPYATPGLIAFGAFALPAGWLADKWSREGMMVVFFLGIGLASVTTSAAQTPVQIGIGLFIIGVFAAIYHPVGLSMIARGGPSMGMDIAINGVWGNLGVGSAALLTGILIDLAGWRAAFWVPGIISIIAGVAYLKCFADRISTRNASSTSLGLGGHANNSQSHAERSQYGLLQIAAIIFFTTAVSGIIFQGTTFSLPKVFEERLGAIAPSATLIGGIAFLVFSVASGAQIMVGRQLDRHSPRNVFLIVALIQVVFFALMPGLTGWPAVGVSLVFMLGAFGQIPINDYMIGRMARSELRASVYGARYIVSFIVWASVVPLIAWVHHNWGFDLLFYILSGCATSIMFAVILLPKRLPGPVAA